MAPSAGDALRALLQLPPSSSSAFVSQRPRNGSAPPMGVARQFAGSEPRTLWPQAAPLPSSHNCRSGQWGSDLDEAGGEEPLFADLSLSESEPPLSPQPSDADRCSNVGDFHCGAQDALPGESTPTSGGAAKRVAAAGFAITTPAKGSAAVGARRTEPAVSSGVEPAVSKGVECQKAEAAPVAPPSAIASASSPMAWFLALPREQQECLRRCRTPRTARRTLQAFRARSRGIGRQTGLKAGRLSAEAATISADLPAGFIEDLRRHTQAANRRAMDLEDELRAQAIAHAEQLQALREDNRKTCRRAKLQLLAQVAPTRNAALEALACDPNESVTPVVRDLLAGMSPWHLPQLPQLQLQT
mmetsp:Transcript_141535/g.368837  ORF Transcript_141535/g.368837 Transcript_141535/m.368837 type:complete len:358 (+) Transcript_141535:85-1158(+)